MTDKLRTDFDQFLFASIVDDANGVGLTMLSLLARQGVDPWAEAADLAKLPPESATQKLVALLASVTSGPSPGADTAALASRLVALLHGTRGPASSIAADAPAAPVTPGRSPVSNKVAWILLALICLYGANWAFNLP
jgi:hypothetical protein